jgi:hypothetical protein
MPSHLNAIEVLGQSFCEDADQKLAYKFSINEEQKNVALLKYDDQNELVDKVNFKKLQFNQ